MPRDSTGNYASPSSQFNPNTTISSNVMNGKLNDIGDEITDSLSRSGKGGMTGALRCSNGTIGAPSLSFSNDTGYGWYRNGSGDIRFSGASTDIQKWSTAEVRVYNAFKVSAGGITVDAGGLIVTAGGFTVTAGGLTVVAGGASLTGSAPSQGGVAGANTLEASGSLSGVSGEGHALTTLAKFNAGGNVGRLNARSQNRTTVVDWHEVRAGLSYDIDNVVGSGGSAYFSYTEGLRISGAVDATATDPTNAVELANGNLKLSGTPPAKDESIANTLTSANIINVRATVEPNATTPVLHDGIHVQTVATSGANVFRITFNTSFANANYTATFGTNDGTYMPIASAMNAAYIEVGAQGGAALGTSYAGSSATRIMVQISGRQA